VLVQVRLQFFLSMISFQNTCSVYARSETSTNAYNDNIANRAFCRFRKCSSVVNWRKLLRLLIICTARQ